MAKILLLHKPSAFPVYPTHIPRGIPNWSKKIAPFMWRMLYGDTTDAALAIVVSLTIFSCCSATLLTALFPCSCNPRRDCKRNCSDCKRDRQRCRKRWFERERADTEEELVSAA